jgi:hypothetical protein
MTRKHIKQIKLCPGLTVQGDLLPFASLWLASLFAGPNQKLPSKIFSNTCC